MTGALSRAAVLIFGKSKGLRVLRLRARAGPAQEQAPGGPGGARRVRVPGGPLPRPERPRPAAPVFAFCEKSQFLHCNSFSTRRSALF